MSGLRIGLQLMDGLSAGRSPREGKGKKVKVRTLDRTIVQSIAKSESLR